MRVPHAASGIRVARGKTSEELETIQKNTLNSLKANQLPGWLSKEPHLFFLDFLFGSGLTLLSEAPAN